MKKVSLLFICLCIFSACVVEESSSSDDELPETPLYPLSSIQVPTQGLLGEDLLLTANNLVSNNLIFKFDEFTANAYQQSTDSVILRVPRNLDNIQSQISILTPTDSLIQTSDFQLKAPHITGVEKPIVSFNEDVWIYGENFDNDFSYIQVNLNGISADIMETTRDSVQIRIPNSLTTQTIDVEIHAQLQQTSAQQLMTLRTPEIASTDQVVSVGGIMEIEGINFSGDSENGQFIINDEIIAHTESIENNTLARIRVPYGPYEDFEIYKVTYEVAEMQASLNTNIVIDSQYILHTKDNISPLANIRHYNDKSYTIASDGEDENGTPLNFLYELDYTTRAWTKINSVSFSGYDFRETITDNGFLYVFLSNFSTGNQFYKINLNAFNIEPIVPPSFNQYRVSPAFFFHDNQIIYGKGKEGYGITDPFYTDLYSYDITTDTWSALTTDNTEFYSDADYNYQNNSYISSFIIQTFPIYELKYFDDTNNTFTAVVPSGSYTTENVFEYQNRLLRATEFPSLDEFRIFEHNELNTLGIVNTQQIQGSSKYFAKDDKVFFYSSVTNDVYFPSNGFYLINPNITNPL